jgi:hypothetical protein
MLFEMLTGRVPFEGETPLSVALKHKSQMPKNPRELNPHINAALAGVILKCLEKDRNKRYQSADDLRTDLDRILQGLPTTETNFAKRDPITSREITVTFRLKKLLVPGLVVLGLAGLVLIGRLTVFKPKSSQASFPSSDTRLVVVPPAPAGKTSFGTLDTSPRSSPSRSIIGFLVGEAQKYIKAEDLDKIKTIQEPQLFLESLKKLLPQDNAPLMETWNKAYEKVKEGKKYETEGRRDLAQKSNQEGRMQMNELLSLVEARQSVQAARDEMDRSKTLAQKAGRSEKNILFLMARNEESSAEDALNKNDLSGAKTLYRVLGKIYRLSSGCETNEACLKSIQAYVAEQKMDVEAMNPAAVDAWTYEFAGEIVNQAASFLSVKKQPENAVASYIQAAFLYEKIKEKTRP